MIKKKVLGAALFVTCALGISAYAAEQNNFIFEKGDNSVVVINNGEAKSDTTTYAGIYTDGLLESAGISDNNILNINFDGEGYIDRYIGCVKVFQWDNKMKPAVDPSEAERYYAAVVDSTVSMESGTNWIYFSSFSCGNYGKIKWNNNSGSVKLIKNGTEITVQDLNEGDVLNLPYIASYEIEDTDSIVIYVISESVTGIVSSVDEGRNTVTIDGMEYQFNYKMTDVYDITPGCEYTLYPDMFGFVADYKETGKRNDYGIIKGITSEGDTTRVQLIDASGSSAEYIVDSESIELLPEDNNAVIRYSVNDDKLSVINVCSANGGAALEYREISNKFGPYQINREVTTIINMSGDTPEVMDISELVNYYEYDAYLYDKNYDGFYRFAVIYNITEVSEEDRQPVERHDTEMAVINKAVNGKTYNVIAYGNEYELNLTEDADLAEGDVVAYTGSDIKAVILHAPANYSDLYSSVFANNDFSAALGDVTDENNIALYDKDCGNTVKLYFGVVYKCSSTELELLTSQSEGVSDINDAETFKCLSANRMTFDYAQIPNHGVRAQLSSYRQNGSFFNNTYSDYDKSMISWSMAKENDINPTFALVKEVDGSVTDVVYYTTD